MMKLDILTQKNQKLSHFMQGVTDMLPLSLAVIPWAIMAGSLAITAGLSFIQALGMSVFVFAGAAQIMSLSMLMAGVPIFVIVITVFFMTMQHFIYSLSLRKDLADLNKKQRLSIGFLLTDELYAVSKLYPHRSYRYLLGAGLSFYIFWVVFSLVGILCTSLIKDLSTIHLDYSIVAIFLVMTIFLIKNSVGMIAVLISGLIMFILTYLNIKSGIILASLMGMFVAALLDRGEQS